MKQTECDPDCISEECIRTTFPFFRSCEPHHNIEEIACPQWFSVAATRLRRVGQTVRPPARGDGHQEKTNMKPSTTLPMAIVLLGLGVIVNCADTHAATMTPVNSVFQASGETNLLVGPLIGAPCTSTIHGVIDGSGNAVVDGAATVMDSTDAICKVIRGAGQWTLVPTSATTAELRDVRFGAELLFECTGTVPGNLNNGVFTFDADLESDLGFTCHFSGELHADPAIGIAWP